LRGEYWNSADIKLRKLDADKILKQVKEEVFKLSGVTCAIVFGSFARGNYSGTSDVDLLLIIKENIPIDARYRKYNRIRADTDVQVIILTLDEVLQRLHQGDTFILEIITTRFPVKGGKIFEKLKKISEKVIRKYGLKRTEIGWIRKNTRE